MSKSIARFVLVAAFLSAGACSDEIQRLPQASAEESQALAERLKGLISEARALKPDGAIALLHHFSDACLSRITLADFKARAAGFITAVQAGKFEGLEIQGARVPEKGRVRLLLIKSASGKGVVPFSKTDAGFKVDDVDAAFGDYKKKLEMFGAVPAFPAQLTSAVAKVQDGQASLKERFKEALRLNDASVRDLLDRLIANEKSAPVRAALLHAQWRLGGPCEAFAKAYPVERDVQKELYDVDPDSFRTLVAGLSDCAKSSNSPEPTARFYEACRQAEDATRSEYVESVVALANTKPQLVLRAAVRAKIPFEQDPVANIVIGALHCDKKSPMIQLLNKQGAKKRKPTKVSVAKLWLQKITQRDQEEPCNDKR